MQIQTHQATIAALLADLKAPTNYETNHLIAARAQLQAASDSLTNHIATLNTLVKQRETDIVNAQKLEAQKQADIALLKAATDAANQPASTAS